MSDRDPMLPVRCVDCGTVTYETPHYKAWIGKQNELCYGRLEAFDRRARPAPADAWISVKDRLPKIGKFYLVNSGDGGVFVGAYFTSSPGQWAVHTNQGPTWIDGVTHWRPLPEPPESSPEEGGENTNTSHRFRPAVLGEDGEAHLPRQSAPAETPPHGESEPGGPDHPYPAR